MICTSVVKSHTFNLLWRRSRKMVRLSLVRRATAVPEKGPLQRLVALQLVLEPKRVVLVVELEQIQELRRRLVHGKRRRLGIVDQSGDAAVGVEAEEPAWRALAMPWRCCCYYCVPFLLLLVGADVDQRRGPRGAVLGRQLFQHDLCGLSVGRVLRDQVQALGVGHVRGRVGLVELVRHVGELAVVGGRAEEGQS